MPRIPRRSRRERTRSSYPLRRLIRRRLRRILLAILMLSAGSIAAARADLDAGRRAYETGDYTTAMKELSPLAEQGNADAQVLVGLMYFRGYGVSKDFGTALKWYKAAADQGHAEGLAHLGSMYFMGAGATKDISKAFELWKLSANQGNVGAQVSLGLAYRNARDVPHNFVQSYMWFQLAAASGDALAARQRDDLQRLMSPAEIEKARALARDWKPASSSRPSPQAGERAR